MNLVTCPHCGGALPYAKEKDNSYAVQKARLRDERAIAMLEAYKKDVTLEDIGACFGLTRERVRQIITKWNGGPVLGGRTVLIELNKAHSIKDKKWKKEAKMFATYGCSVEFIEAANNGMRLSDGKSPAGKYRHQKGSAKTRSIEFNLTFKEWWDIWQESGRWSERGRGNGYCMARVGDTGPYSVDNVEIKTASDNSSESYYKHPAREREAKRGKKITCVRGHDLSVTKNSHGNCSECCRIRTRDYYLRKTDNKKAKS